MPHSSNYRANQRARSTISRYQCNLDGRQLRRREFTFHTDERSHARAEQFVRYANIGQYCCYIYIYIYDIMKACDASAATFDTCEGGITLLLSPNPSWWVCHSRAPEIVRPQRISREILILQYYKALNINGKNNVD